jgi:extracellular matrix regulatory protein B
MRNGMYIHLGEDVMIRTDELVAILDKKSVQESTIMKQFLNSKDKNIMNLAKGDFKSLVITNHRIYLSPLASITLNKRSMTEHQPDLYI